MLLMLCGDKMFSGFIPVFSERGTVDIKILLYPCAHATFNN